MGDIFTEPDVIRNTAAGLIDDLADSVRKITGEGTASDERFANLTTTGDDAVRKTAEDSEENLDTATRAVSELEDKDNDSATSVSKVEDALRDMTPSSEERPALPSSVQDSLSNIATSLSAASTPTEQGWTPMGQEAIRAHMADQAMNGQYQAPQNIYAQQPPQTQYQNGIMPSDQLQTQMNVQNSGSGAVQSPDLVHLSPEQMRILAEYLADQSNPDVPDGGSAGGKEVGDIDTSSLSGEYEEDVLDLADEVVDANNPYAWGGGSLYGPSQGIHDGGVADSFGDYAKKGFDCSGLSRYMTYQTTGVEIPRTAAEQYNFCDPVDEPEIGDLGFPPGGNPGHVVIYVGDGQIVEAQQSGTNVMFSDAPGDYEWGRVPS